MASGSFISFLKQKYIIRGVVSVRSRYCLEEKKDRQRFTYFLKRFETKFFDARDVWSMIQIIA